MTICLGTYHTFTETYMLVPGPFRVASITSYLAVHLSWPMWSFLVLCAASVSDPVLAGWACVLGVPGIVINAVKQDKATGYS